MTRETKRKTKPRETSRHLEAFESWYEAKRNFSITSQRVMISRRSLFQWAEDYEWHERADARDAKAARIAEAAAVKEQAKRLIDHRKAGELLRGRGMKYFVKNEVRDERVALSAIKTGIDIERQADGLPDWVIQILNADTDELQKRRDELDARRRAAMADGELAPGDDGTDETDDE